MSLVVKVVPRILLTDENREEVRYYGSVKSRQLVSFEQLCKRVSHSSLSTKGDVQLVLKGFLSLLEEYLAMGKSVKLDSLGCFRLSAGSKGVESEEDFHVSAMRQPRLTFVASMRLKRMAERVKFTPEVKLKKVRKCEQLHYPA